ncbi:hypothetical protein HDU78_001250 [Chytriomyces hyalinus]|nr:hypothetical protein HDU78_001250 [Chytriomyces hyalinus]
MSDQPTDAPISDPPPVDPPVEQPSQDQPPVQQPDPTAAAPPPATSTGLPAMCLPLKGSTACPEFASLQAYIPAEVNIRDLAAFDSLIKSSLIVSNTPGTFGGMARGFCPAWDGTGIRYYQSSLCGYFIGMGVTNGVAGTNCNPAGSVNMCASTLTKFAASWKTSAFGAKAGCAAENPVTQLGVTYSMPSGALSSASTCVVSVAAESSNCGFATAAESKAFCATTPTEACCNAGGAGAASAAVKATIATTTAAIATIVTSAAAPVATQAAATGLSQTTIMYIAAGGGGGLFLIVLIIVLVCCCKRKTKQSEDSDYAAQQFSNNVPMKSMQSPQAAYANDRSLLNQNAAPMGVGQPPMMGGPGAQKDMYEAVYDYNPQQPDELDTRVGDKIIIKTEFDDGWAFGFNTRTRREGHFPLDILDKWAQQQEGGQNNAGVSMYSKRQSSMYGGKPAAGTDSMYYGGNATDSVYYGDAANTQSVYGTESMYVDNRAGGKFHKAAYDFTPAMPDEMELRVGDTIELKHEYDDGWGFGRNEVTGQEGLFPLDCLPGFGEDQGYDEQGKKKHNNRASSIYGGQQSMYGTDSMYQPGGANSMYGTDSVYQGNNTDSMYYGNNTDSVYYGNNTDSMYDAPAPQKGRR